MPARVARQTELWHSEDAQKRLTEAAERLRRRAADQTDQALDQVGRSAYIRDRNRGSPDSGRSGNAADMTRQVKIGEAKTHLSALLAEVEAGEDLVICRGPTPIARVTRISRGEERAALLATLRRERAKQKAVTTSEILSWRHEGHTR